MSETQSSESDSTLRTRIPPLPAAERDDQARELLAVVTPPDGEPLNVFATLVRHPDLFRAWLRFAGRLLTAGTLPARDRELLILATASRCGVDYEWGHHVPMAKDAGITDEEISRIRAGSDAAGWSPWDATLLGAVEELCRSSRLSDQTWTALVERYDERQLIELPMLVGQYQMLAGTLGSLGTPLEPGLERLRPRE